MSTPTSNQWLFQDSTRDDSVVNMTAPTLTVAAAGTTTIVNYSLSLNESGHLDCSTSSPPPSNIGAIMGENLAEMNEILNKFARSWATSDWHMLVAAIREMLKFRSRLLQEPTNDQIPPEFQAINELTMLESSYSQTWSNNDDRDASRVENLSKAVDCLKIAESNNEQETEKGGHIQDPIKEELERFLIFKEPCRKGKDEVKAPTETLQSVGHDKQVTEYAHNIIDQSKGLKPLNNSDIRLLQEDEDSEDLEKLKAPKLEPLFASTPMMNNTKSLKLGNTRTAHLALTPRTKIKQGLSPRVTILFSQTRNITSKSSYHYACNVCKKAFVKSCDLQIHVNATHKGMRHPCLLCGKTFVTKGNLLTHVEKYHPTNEDATTTDFSTSYFTTILQRN